MTPERVAFYAEQAWPAGHEETSVRAIERAIRQAEEIDMLARALVAVPRHKLDNYRWSMFERNHAAALAIAKERA